MKIICFDIPTIAFELFQHFIDKVYRLNIESCLQRYGLRHCIIRVCTYSNL